MWHRHKLLYVISFTARYQWKNVKREQERMLLSKFKDFFHSLALISHLSQMSRQNLLTPGHNMTVNGIEVATNYYKFVLFLMNGINIKYTRTLLQHVHIALAATCAV
jgi:hypothetical protein